MCREGREDGESFVRKGRRSQKKGGQLINGDGVQGPSMVSENLGVWSEHMHFGQSPIEKTRLT